MEKPIIDKLLAGSKYSFVALRRCISSSISVASVCLCLPGVVPDIWVGKKGGEGCGPGSGCVLAWRGFGNQRTSSCFITGKGGPQNCQVTPKLAVRRPSLQTEILSPALLLHSLCRQLSGPLEHVHGQVVSSSANIHEYLLSQDCAGHSGCYNSG